MFEIRQKRNRGVEMIAIAAIHKSTDTDITTVRMAMTGKRCVAWQYPFSGAILRKWPMLKRAVKIEFNSN